MQRSFWLGILGVGLACSALVGCEGNDPAANRIAFLQVAQGDCTVLQSAGQVVMVDCGARNETFDAGERLVTPELYDLGVHQIDLLILTHPDSDHVGGLVSLARRFAIGRILIAECFRYNADMNGWLQRAHIGRDKVIWVQNHREAKVGEWTIDVFAPTPDQPASDNDGSLFTKISGPRGSAVLTGDAPMFTEQIMLGRGVNWHADILKAGHHGSAGSTSSTWIRAVDPRYAIISCGRNNPYGHPSSACLDRLQENAVEIERTDRDGTIIFQPTDKGFRLAE